MASRKDIHISELYEEMSSINYDIGSHFYAKPTYLIDPHNFYIMPFPFLFHLPTTSKAGKPLQLPELKEKMIVVYTSKNPDVNKYFKIDLDENIRGVIQRIEDDKCLIYALDRGFLEEDVTVDRIFYPACEDALTVPSLVQHCELYFCAPKGENFSKDSVDAFKFFFGNEKLSVVVKGLKEDKLSIVVYNSNPDDIATLLALTHYTYLVGTIKNDLDSLTIKKAQTKFGYHHMELSLGDILTVRVQSGLSLKDFYVTPVLDYKEYVQNRSDFTNYCRSLQEISQKDYKTGACVGVYDDSNFAYERGIILEPFENKAKVKLVDWGTEMLVHKHKIKAIKTRIYLQSPVKAIFCKAVEGFVPWDNGLPKFLYKGYTFAIKIKEVGREFETPHTVAMAQA